MQEIPSLWPILNWAMSFLDWVSHFSSTCFLSLLASRQILLTTYLAALSRDPSLESGEYLLSLLIRGVGDLLGDLDLDLVRFLGGDCLGGGLEEDWAGVGRIGGGGGGGS